MGFFQDVAKKIRSAWAKDKEQFPIQFAKGQNPAGTSPDGPELLQAYGYDVVADYLRLEGDLLARYVDYENMDDYGEISSAITIFADDATQTDTQLNRTIWVTSPDKEVEENLNYLLQKTLRIDEEIWEITRVLALYGNDFEELLVTDEGVRGISFLAPPTVRRVEGTRGELYGFIQDIRGRFNFTAAEFQQILATRSTNASSPSKSDADKQQKAVAFEDWEVVHFRLRGKHRRCLRGTSRVSTPNGPKEIKDLSPGDIVHTFDGMQTTTTKVVASGQTGVKSVFAVKTRHRTVVATSEHPFLVSSKQGYYWKPLSKLSCDDFLVIPSTVEPVQHEQITSIDTIEGDPEPVFDIQVEHVSHSFIADGVVVHNSVYGHSVLEAARWIYKRLMLLEDSALIYRLQRAPERYAFYVDVGSLPPQESMAWLNKVRQQFRKKKFVNPSTGHLDLKVDVLPVAFDTPIPLMDGRVITIEEMAREHSEGVKHWVYSIDDQKGITAGEVSWVGKTRSNGAAVKITFDDDGYAVMAPDHPVMRRDGSYVNAIDLRIDDSVMPWRKISSEESVANNVLANTDSRKVTFIEFVAPCDHYCMTVEKWHNFALLLRDKNGFPIVISGIVVKNSNDEDFWIPVREGAEGVRVETLGAPNWQSVDDINYFLDKLYSTLLIPKAYFSQDDSSSRQVLSSQDVRFARSVLRIQRELKNGFSKVCRVHLAAIGVDPSSVEYTLHMTTPSAIFELAQLEVRNARADLAARMGEFASFDWIMSKVFGLNEDEISVLKQQREEDKIRDFVAEARAQAAGQDEFPGFQPGMPASGFAPPPQMPGDDPNQFGQPGADQGQEPPTTDQPNDQAAPGGESKQRPNNLYSNRISKTSWSRKPQTRERPIADTSKRLEAKLDQVLREDRKLGKRVKELGLLLRDLRASGMRVQRPRQ